jgi:hypothetical protein
MNYVTVEKTEKYIDRSVDAELLKWKADLSTQTIAGEGCATGWKIICCEKPGEKF